MSKCFYVVSQAQFRSQTRYEESTENLFELTEAAPEIYAVFPNEEEAIQLIRESVEDLYESGTYPYITLEEYEFGIFPIVRKTTVWEFDTVDFSPHPKNAENSYIPIEMHTDPLTISNFIRYKSPSPIASSLLPVII